MSLLSKEQQKATEYLLAMSVAGNKPGIGLDGTGCKLTQELQDQRKAEPLKALHLSILTEAFVTTH